MGTRNLTKVIDKNGVIKVAQYGQWDGYPAGQGLTALYHLKGSLKLIEAGLAKCVWTTDEVVQAIYNTMPNAHYDFSTFYPNLTRDTGADILGVVAYSVGEVSLVDNSDFENDDLFCEAIYTIDFQQGKFISQYNGYEVVFDLNDLPEPQEYLDAFDKEREMAELD